MGTCDVPSRAKMRVRHAKFKGPPKTKQKNTSVIKISTILARKQWGMVSVWQSTVHGAFIPRQWGIICLLFCIRCGAVSRGVT